MNLNAERHRSQNPFCKAASKSKTPSCSHNDFPSGLSDLNGVLLFDRNRIQIESLTGTTGGGTIALTGSATYQNGTFLIDFGATAHDVRLRYPPGVSSTANADLRLTGSRTSALLEWQCRGHQACYHSWIRLRRLYRKEQAVGGRGAERQPREPPEARRSRDHYA